MSLWPLAIGLGGAAVAAGTLAVPAVRRWTFGSVEFDWQGHELELDRIDDDGITVRMKSGTVMRAIPAVTKGEAHDPILRVGFAPFPRREIGGSKVKGQGTGGVAPKTRRAAPAPICLQIFGAPRPLATGKARRLPIDRASGLKAP